MQRHLVVRGIFLLALSFVTAAPAGTSVNLAASRAFTTNGSFFTATKAIAAGADRVASLATYFEPGAAFTLSSVRHGAVLSSDAGMDYTPAQNSVISGGENVGSIAPPDGTPDIGLVLALGGNDTELSATAAEICDGADCDLYMGINSLPSTPTCTGVDSYTPCVVNTALTSGNTVIAKVILKNGPYGGLEDTQSYTRP
jgi:hypothetical protein